MPLPRATTQVFILENTLDQVLIPSLPTGHNRTLASLSGLILIDTAWARVTKGAYFVPIYHNRRACAQRSFLTVERGERSL